MFVYEEESSINSKYNENLKEFLSPTFQYDKTQKDKKIGKRLKTHAQALGMNKLQKENESNDNSKNEKEKEQPKDKNTNNDLRKVIKSMEKQMIQLKEMIVLMCDTII